MRMRRAIASLTAAAVIAGCGGTEAQWDGPAAPAGDGTIAVDDFNAYAESADERWTRSPVSTAAEFLRLDREDVPATSVVVKRGGEATGDAATAIVTLDRLLDDSVRALRYTLQLARADDGRWLLRSARREVRCWPGRGHQDFSLELCL